jgi:hypothetical protein
MNHESHDRLEALLGQVPVDDAIRPEHREQLRQDALAAFDRARPQLAVPGSSPTQPNFWSWLMTHRTPRWTAVCLAFATALGWMLWPDANRQAFAFDDLIDSIMEAKTAKCRMTVAMEGQPEQQMTAYFEGSRFRQEFAMGLVNIADWGAGKMVNLNPMDKSATVFNLKNMPQANRPTNMFEDWRKQLGAALTQKDAQVEKLGTQEIAGRQAVGYRFITPPQPLEVWGDAKTNLPVKIVSVMPGPPRTTVTMSDFEFNVPMEASLFSTEPPAGYKVQTLEMEASPPSEADFITALKLCATHADGAFPDTLDAFTVGKLIAGMVARDRAMTDAETSQLMQHAVTLGRGLQYPITMLPSQGAATWYAGKGAKLGDAGRAIFWSKGKDATAFRVIYGDLTAKDETTAPQVEGAVQLYPQTGNATP